MDVPFVSSGAMSRAHYSTVRKVENAPSAQAADEILLREIESIRHQLANSKLHINECRESLVLLLYCSMTLGCSSSGALDFALPHALNLAETGQSTQYKRIGYLFCHEVMPPKHELQLMCINTLRKDLENTHIPRICLALDVIIQSATEDVIPAVQSRLHDLLSHNSPYVRRRALLALRVLSRFDEELLARIEGKIIKRMKDPDFSVCHAALIVSAPLLHSDKVHSAVNNMLASAWAMDDPKLRRRWLMVILESLRTVKPSSNSVYTIIEIIRYAAEPTIAPLLLEAFALLSCIPSTSITRAQEKLGLSSIDIVRPLLTSADINEQYLFITCLKCIDPGLWAGTIPNTTAILDELEVERIMRLLDSNDSLIRRNTLTVLHNVDPGIVEAFYSQLLQRMPSTLLAQDREEYVSRLLEILEMQCGSDGDIYAARLGNLLAAVDTGDDPDNQPVIGCVVERILVYVRNLGMPARLGFVTTLMSPLVEPDVRVGSTLMVILSALACEFAGKISISPLAILRGLSSRLQFYAPTVQDACLLSMLRLSAECNEVPSDVTKAVNDLSQLSRKHIRRQCEQFLSLSGQQQILREMIATKQSSSLPEFQSSITEYQNAEKNMKPELSRVETTGVSSPRANNTASLSKLRYAAYAAPQPTPSRRLLRSPRMVPTSPLSDSSGRLRSLSRASDASSSIEPLARTLTPGELTLAAGDNLLLRSVEVGDGQGDSDGYVSAEGSLALDEIASGVNLISLDPPLISDMVEPKEPDFKMCWEGMEDYSARGWCEATMDIIVRRLQRLKHRLVVIAVDQPPYEGDLKVLVQQCLQAGSYRYAALRLKESDDEGCLWRARCQDDGLRMAIKRELDGN